MTISYGKFVTGYDRDVDDLAFRFVTERPSLALTATVGERWDRGIERLRTPSDLRRWLAELGLRARPDQADLVDAKELREAIYDAAKSTIDGSAPTARGRRTINGFAARPTLVPQLTTIGMRWDPSTMPAILSWLARDAIDLLGGPDRARLRECASPTCGLLFTDTSRPGRRRWCSSERCGGAARAAEYRRRHC